MLHLDALFEFSRTYCVAICAVLVPANLLATLQTLLFTWWQRPLFQVQATAGMATVYALVMVLHVSTWFMIGVVRGPTYILLGLSSVCLCANGAAIAYYYSRLRTSTPNSSLLSTVEKR